MLRLIQLDANNVVEQIFDQLPPYTQLSDRFCIAPPHVGVGWDFVPETQTFNPPGRRRWVTRLGFRNRFTTAELVSLEIASLDNPSGTAQQRQQAASIRVLLANLQAASYIDLDRPDTRAGVQQLEAGTLLGVGRAAEILDGPISAEQYHPDA